MYIVVIDSMEDGRYSYEVHKGTQLIVSGKGVTADQATVDSANLVKSFIENDKKHNK